MGSRGKHRPNKRERLIFSGVLICAECGCPYSHIQPHSKSMKVIPKWKCKNYMYQNRVSEEAVLYRTAKWKKYVP